MFGAAQFGQEFFSQGTSFDDVVLVVAGAGGLVTLPQDWRSLEEAYRRITHQSNSMAAPSTSHIRSLIGQCFVIGECNVSLFSILTRSRKARTLVSIDALPRLKTLAMRYDLGVLDIYAEQNLTEAEMMAIFELL